MPSKIDDWCRQIVPLQYFGYFFNKKKKCVGISVTFGTFFGFRRKLKLGFCLQERIRKERRKVEITLSSDSVIALSRQALSAA